MAGTNYNRGRYYTRSQQLSEQRDDLKELLRLRSENEKLRAEVQRLTAELKEVKGE